MKLTKYNHACFTVENENKLLVVDPGNFTDDFIPSDNIVAVVITHQHPDHFEPELIAQIFAQNDNVLILGPSDVINQVKVENKRAVTAGETVDAGPFKLEFFGGTHAQIDESIPRIQNLGVMVNDMVYYPGDSFTIPERSIDTLALPAAAPWMKISEVMSFLRDTRPRFAFPTHDAISSDKGQTMVDGLLSRVAKDVGTEYLRLTDSIDV